MGTSNFSSSTNVIHAVDCDNELTYSDTRHNLQSEFNAIDKDKSNVFEFVNKNEWDGDRNFSGKIIGQLYTTLDYLGYDFSLDLNIIMRSGYYSGFNMDYEFSCGYDGDSWDDIESMVNDLEEYGLDSTMKGLYAIHGAKLRTKLDTLHDELKLKAIEVFKQYSDQLVVTAQFSNGETFYEKVKED